MHAEQKQIRRHSNFVGHNSKLKCGILKKEMIISKLSLGFWKNVINKFHNYFWK